MKRILAIISLIVCLCLRSAIYAQDENASSIVIYNFSISGVSSDSEYYSFIIPDALARQLQETNEIETERIIAELHPGSSAEKTSLEILRNAARDDNTECVITGTVMLSNMPTEVKPDKNKLRVKPGLKKKTANTKIDPKQRITLTVLVYDAVLDKSLVVSTEPFLAGALLQDAIDAICMETAGKLAVFEEEKKAQAQLKEQEESPSLSEPSPYLSLFSIFSNITLGMDAGTLLLLGSYGDEYKNTQMISPWINFSMGGGLGLSLGMNYFASDNKAAEIVKNNLIQCWSALAGSTYTWQITEWFAPVISVSGGLTRTIIDEYPATTPDMPFTDYKNKKSFDPCLDISAALRFSLRPVHVRTGLLYKRVFNSDSAINALSIFAGLALSF